MAKEPRSYVVRGRVTDSRGSPVPGVRVRAYDRDLLFDDALGEDETSRSGTYEVRFREEDFRELFLEGQPEVYVVVLRGEEEIHRTRPVRLHAGETEMVLDVELREAHVPGGRGSAGGGGGAPGGGGGAGRQYAPSEPAGPPSSSIPVGSGGPPSPSVPATNPSDPGKEPPMRLHGEKSRNYIAPRSSFYGGPFGRLFRELAPWAPPGANEGEQTRALADLATAMEEADGRDPALDNPGIPSGYTYFGQFVDHDITFDPVSSLERQNDPDRLHNFRTPKFDLDNVYGRGPADDPFMYDRHPKRFGRFLIGEGRDQGSVRDEDIQMSRLPGTGERDLPRNEQGRALLGDPRNDENIIVSQLQLAFLLFHNAAMDWVEAKEGLTGDDAFVRAQTLVRWHYQWVVLHDFLKRIVDPALVDFLLPHRGRGHEYCPTKFNLCFYKPEYNAFMPVEFSVAAYRLGHSMIRGGYALNRIVTGVPIFKDPKPPTGEDPPGPLEDLRGFRPLPGKWTLEWARFLEIGGSTPQPSRRIDSKLARALSTLPAGPGGRNPLALLNLLRGWRMGLPSGQAVARAMGLQPIDNATLGLPTSFVEAPLWYYILKEAELQQNGERLGEVGGRIVAEVFVGLAKEDNQSFLNIDPLWEPVFPAEGRRFELRDIIRFAGVADNPFP